MNDRVRTIAVVGVLLLAALVVGATYWQAWAVGDLADKQDNAIQRIAQFTIDRGEIRAENTRPFARNKEKRVSGQTFYLRRYPTGKLAAAAVGYSTQARSRTGLERSMNDYLTASNSNLHTLISKTLDSLSGKTIKGNSLVLSLSPSAQFVALRALDGNCGAAVAIQPKTGRVLVMATSPTYNPNLVESNFDRIGSIRGVNCRPPAPLLNRATAGLYPPGSTFKLVTAAAALDSGKFTPHSTFYDPGYCVEYGKPVKNFSDQNGPEVFGNVTLALGLQHSINSVFCNIGKSLGALTVLDYAKRFGFYELPPLETPRDERRASGLYKNGSLYRPAKGFQVDPGRLAFGQERLGVTPMQMAMVASAIGNGGLLMKPHVVDRILKPGGGVLQRTKLSELGRPISPRTARELTAMMEAVVRAGTGTNAQIPGVRVAGKTGTAETGFSHRNTTWFVAFAPADNPQVAVAVTLENQSGTGGATAAPIAKSIMEALLHQPSS